MKTYICAALRSPIASFQGSLASFSAPQLGALVIKALVEKLALSPEEIDEVYMGCVLTAGLGQAPARQAALGAGLAQKTPCTTVGKVCGSGLKSVMLADMAIRAGEAKAVIAGGMESMSQSPYLIPKMRGGLRLGHGELVDSMIKDGLWDVYNNFHMGSAAELCAQKYNLSREAQDAYATESLRRAKAAASAGKFRDEIVPIAVKSKKDTVMFSEDEQFKTSDPARFAGLKPVFDPKGTITAANASTLNDGAAALFLCDESYLKAHNLKALARIEAQSQVAQAPEWFTTAPALGVQALLKKAGKKTSDIDLFEINEAFAAVALANNKILELDPTKVNTRGGAVALGHPIGASGARILTTLLHALQQDKKKWGVASICLGGGEAASLLVENLA